VPNGAYISWPSPYEIAYFVWMENDNMYKTKNTTKNLIVMTY
jgi:hypothetical protein